jgi:hypothetical protein
MLPRHNYPRAAALALILAAAVLAPGASEAGHREHDWRKAKHRWRHAKRYDGVRYVPMRRSGVILVRPASEACFVVRQKKAVVIRPVPYWSVPYGNGVNARLGIHGDQVDFDLAFRQRELLYGCNFCDAHFPAYATWNHHVLVCRYRPPVRVIVEPWEDDELVYFCQGARYSCARYDDDWDDDDWDDDEDEGDDDD